MEVYINNRNIISQEMRAIVYVWVCPLHLVCGLTTLWQAVTKQHEVSMYQPMNHFED